MQTITINIKNDSIAEKILWLLDRFKDEVEITRDENLKNDSSYYEKQQELQQIRDDIKSGKSKTTSFEDFKIEMDNLEKEFEATYAN